MQEMKESDVFMFFNELFKRTNLVLTVFEAKEQLKILYKVLPNCSEFKGILQDPRVCEWLLDPDMKFSWQNVVEKYKEEYIEILSLVLRSYGNSCNIALSASSLVEPRLRAAVEAFLSKKIIEAQLQEMEKTHQHLVRVFTGKIFFLFLKNWFI